MEFIIKKTIQQLSEQKLFLDLGNIIYSYINKLDFFELKYSRENVLCISSYNDMIAFVDNKLWLFIYKNNILINSFKLICSSKFISSIDINSKYIIIGFVSGDLLIINIETKTIFDNHLLDCITCIKFIDEEHFIACNMNNDIIICRTNGNILFGIMNDSYIMTIKILNENTFITGCVFGNLRYWKINFRNMTINCFKQNTKCIDSIHSIINFDNNILLGSSNDNKIYFEDSKQIFYSDNKIIGIHTLNENYFVVLYDNGYLNIYDKNFNTYRSILVDEEYLENVNNSKICFVKDKIFIHVNENIYLIY